MARPPLTAQQRAELNVTQRRQVIAGLAACITQGSYAATTTRDIAAAARVSKTTLYAHFDDKEDVFAALYEVAADSLLAMVRLADQRAVEAGLPWRARVTADAVAYLDGMVLNPALTRSVLMEGPSTSPRMVVLRRTAIDGFANFITEVGADLAELTPEVRVPRRPLTVAAVGGLREMLLEALDGTHPWDRELIVRSGSEFLVGLLRADPGELS